MKIAAVKLENVLKGLDDFLMERIMERTNLTRRITLRSIPLQNDKLNFFITYRVATLLSSQFYDDSPRHFEEAIQFRNIKYVDR